MARRAWHDGKEKTRNCRTRSPAPLSLESDGWKLDRKESTRRALKYRRDEGQIVIVIHAGRGWFDPLGRQGRRVRSCRTSWLTGSFRRRPCRRSRRFRVLATGMGSAGSYDRARAARQEMAFASASVVRIVMLAISLGSSCAAAGRSPPRRGFRSPARGPKGSMWALHRRRWRHRRLEERGPHWRGFATGGAKTLFRLSAPGARRFAVTEAAIDAMSLGGVRGVTLRHALPQHWRRLVAHNGSSSRARRKTRRRTRGRDRQQRSRRKLRASPA